MRPGPVSEARDDAAIALASVRAGRGGRAVLDALSLEVGRGERVALLGANGVGKSTLLDVVLGLERPSQGTVRVLGAAPPSREVGFVPQGLDASLLPWLSVRDNVELPLRIRGLAAPERARAFDEVRARLDPAGAVDPAARPGTLSGGQRQLVACMRAWIGAPRLVVADEALSAVDLVGRIALRAAMGRACERDGTALLFVTHDLADVAGLAERAIVLAGRPAAIVAELDVRGRSVEDLEQALRGLAPSGGAEGASGTLVGALREARA